MAEHEEQRETSYSLQKRRIEEIRRKMLHPDYADGELLSDDGLTLFQSASGRNFRVENKGKKGARKRER